MAYRVADERGGIRTSDLLRNWIMVAVAVVFTLLYAAALLGWIKPLGDERMVTHLEPIIFVIIGYYFGRFPSQQNELTLKQEIGRQTQKAEVTQVAKEQALLSNEACEEKLKNVRAALQHPSSWDSRGVRAQEVVGQDSSVDETDLQPLVRAALRIINS